MAGPHQVLAPASMAMALMVNTAVRKIGEHSIMGFDEPFELVQLTSRDESLKR